MREELHLVGSSAGSVLGGAGVAVVDWGVGLGLNVVAESAVMAKLVGGSKLPSWGHPV